MWRIVALAILLCSGAGCTNFSQAGTKEWFDAPSPPPLSEAPAPRPAQAPAPAQSASEKPAAPRSPSPAFIMEDRGSFFGNPDGPSTSEFFR